MDKDKLIMRINRNFADYRERILRMPKQDIIQKAEEIAAAQELYGYLRNRHRFDAKEVEYLLRFQNPFEVLQDFYISGGRSADDLLKGVVHIVCDTQDALWDYPLVKPSRDMER